MRGLASLLAGVVLGLMLVELAVQLGLVALDARLAALGALAGGVAGFASVRTVRRHRRHSGGSSK